MNLVVRSARLPVYKTSGIFLEVQRTAISVD
jgi:hypothetical protein